MQPQHLAMNAIFLSVCPLSCREVKKPWLGIDTGLEGSRLSIRRGIGEFLFRKYDSIFLNGGWSWVSTGLWVDWIFGKRKPHWSKLSF
jgi:hypothetical protein